MKKLFLITITMIIIIISGCGDFDDVSKLDNMKKPCIVVAINKETSDKYGSIIIRSCDYKYVTFSGMSTTGTSLINSYKINDTIK